MKNTLRLITALFVLSLGSFAFAGESKECSKDTKECKECKDCTKEKMCDKCKAEHASKDAEKAPEKK